jgi:HD-GYP domain-containing protein (c-di-GMP phosphodiesterase class II)
MDAQLAAAQALKYAQELSQLHAAERRQRRAAEEALRLLEESYRTTVRALAAALELRDDETGGHGERVTGLALELTQEIAPELAENPQLEYGFLLHDLGKIGVPDSILLKPGPLDPDEVQRMRVHPTLGERIVAGIPYLDGVVRDIVGSHHERWDGQGYPRRLRGEHIPLPARIFALADSFDAMTSNRPYRSALEFDEAIAEIEACSGTQFEPRLAEAFVALASDLKSAA